MSGASADLLEVLDKRMRLFIRERIDRLGEEQSGALGYYAYRIQRGYALSGYERGLWSMLRSDRVVIHAGVGMGTLTAALSAGGVSCIGFERSRPRFDAAAALKDAIVPGADYELRHALYPDGLLPGDPVEVATLLFTNVGSGLDADTQRRILATFPRFSRVILDLRLFGEVREAPEERICLLREIESVGMKVEPIDVHHAGASYVIAENA